MIGGSWAVHSGRVCQCNHSERLVSSTGHLKNDQEECSLTLVDTITFARAAPVGLQSCPRCVSLLNLKMFIVKSRSKYLPLKCEVASRWLIRACSPGPVADSHLPLIQHCVKDTRPPRDLWLSGRKAFVFCNPINGLAHM